MESKYKRYLGIPKELWKKYRITISGGIMDSYYITAPTKTMARLFAKGELNPWIKIIKIEEVSA